MNEKFVLYINIFEYHDRLIDANPLFSFMSNLVAFPKIMKYLWCYGNKLKNDNITVTCFYIYARILVYDCTYICPYISVRLHFFCVRLHQYMPVY